MFQPHPIYRLQDVATGVPQSRDWRRCGGLVVQCSHTTGSGRDRMQYAHVSSQVSVILAEPIYFITLLAILWVKDGSPTNGRRAAKRVAAECDNGPSCAPRRRMALSIMWAYIYSMIPCCFFFIYIYTVLFANYRFLTTRVAAQSPPWSRPAIWWTVPSGWFANGRA